MDTLEATTLAAKYAQPFDGGGARLSFNASDSSMLESSTIATLINELALAAATHGQLLNESTLISEEDELKLLKFPSKREDLSTAIPLTVIFALLLVTGCIGNMCTAIVIARPKNKYMHTATNYYLFSLAMSDFLFLILGLPQEMYTLWQRYPYAFGESFCIIRGYLSEASTYASILTISAFTVERYVAICHPLWAHTMSQLPRAITSIVIIWMLAAICAIPPAAELGIVTQTGPITNRTLEESAQCATKRTIYENMFVVSAIVFFIVPMIIVTVLYILIAIELRRSSKMNSAISKQTSAHLSNSHHHEATSSHHSNHHHHKRHCHHHQKSNQKSLQTLDSAHNFLAPAKGSQAALSVASTASAGQQASNSSGEHQTNLMADLMSQRPSSAIGNEHRTARKPALWPALFWTAGNRPAHRCCCRSSLHQSQSHQPSSARPDSPSEAGRAEHLHSPLSYHESLIQRASSKSGQQTHQHQREPELRLFAAPVSFSHLSSLSERNLKTCGCRCHQQRGRNSQQQQQSRKSAAASSKKSVVRMLVAVVVSFFICWVPFHAQRLLASYLVKDENQNQLLFDIYLKLTYISGVMYYLSSTINPLLYQLMSAKFRLAFKETFRCSLFRCAILRRSNGPSPTNSLKEPHHTTTSHYQLHRHNNNNSNHHHLPHLDSRTSCGVGLGASQANVGAGGDAGDTSALGGQQQICSCERPAGACLTGACGQPAGYVARIKGRLNSSLVSLFKFSNQSAAGADCRGCGCCCCPSPPPPPPSSSSNRCSHNNVTHRQDDNDSLPVPGGPRCVGRDAAPLLAETPRSAGEQAYPVTHSMLKFVRQSSPVAPAAPPTSLTRLSSREEEEQAQSAAEEGEKKALAALIQASAGADDSATEQSVSLLASENSATNSSSGSPDNNQQVYQKQAQARNTLGSESSSSSGAAGRLFQNRRKKAPPKPKTTATTTTATATQQNRNDNHMRLISLLLTRNSEENEPEEACHRKSRRKSSLSSSGNKHLSACSLLSSERHLDKKLSLSTTTSALEDYGSYTTTNSQLTGCGSSQAMEENTVIERDNNLDLLYDSDSLMNGNNDDLAATKVPLLSSCSTSNEAPSGQATLCNVDSS